MAPTHAAPAAASKLQARFNEWRDAPGVRFNSPAAETAYKARVELFEDAICLRTPERVPIAVQAGFYSALYAGITPYEAMYNYKKAGDAARKFNADFQTDTLTGAGQGPARAFDILDYKLYRWPGHGLDESAPFQCIESDYMKAGEYEALMDDPSGYFMRSYLPRVFGALEPLQQLNPPTDLLELPMLGPWLRVLARPEVREAFAKLLAAGEAAEEWATACRAVNQEIVAEHGLPSGRGGFTKAPFDTLGDTLRGTRAMMADRFRQPDRVRQAIERWIPLAIEMGVRNSNQSKHPLISIPLHKGADGFMSDEDFRKFYWPSLKAVLLGLINEGVVPCLFAEGGYNDRLDVIADSGLPSGTTFWLFDQTDMKQAKKKFGSWACVSGNVPTSLLKTGKPAEVEDYVRRLIDDVAPGGGFVLSNGAVLDNAEAANLHAMIDTGLKYGSYR